MGRLQKNLNRVHMMKVEDEGASVAQKKDKGGEDDKWRGPCGETKINGDIRNEEE